MEDAPNIDLSAGGGRLVYDKTRRTIVSQPKESMPDTRYMRPGLDFARGKAIEEAGEFLAAIGKSLRWGWLSVNPELPIDQQETNADWVRREMIDLRGALDNLEREMNRRPPNGNQKNF